MSTFWICCIFNLPSNKSVWSIRISPWAGCFIKYTTDPRLYDLILKELKRRSLKNRHKAIELKKFSAISNWYYYAIRQMSKLIDFKDSSSDIKNCLLFPLTEVQINHCLQDLEDLNLIKCDSGIRKATKDHIKTPTDLADEGLKLFHEQMISNAKSSIRLVKPEKRDIQGTW